MLFHFKLNVSTLITCKPQCIWVTSQARCILICYSKHACSACVVWGVYQSYTGKCRVAGEVGGLRLGLPSLPLCLPGNEALSLFTRILAGCTHKLRNFGLCAFVCISMELCAVMWKWVFLSVCVCVCFLLSAHLFVGVKAFILYIAVRIRLCVHACLCVYRVVFSVCESSAVRFPVLPPPPPPSSLFPLSDLREEKKRDI